MLDLNTSGFNEFLESDSSEDIKQLEKAVEGVEFKSRKHGLKALCVLMRINSKEELIENGFLVNTILKNKGFGKTEEE